MTRTELAWRTRQPAEGYYTSIVETPDHLPVRTFLPTGYEPNYPYPLLVFLHGNGGSEEQGLKLAPRVSRRNHIAIGLRGPELIGERPNGRLCYGWGRDGQFDGMIEDYLLRAVEQTRRTYHVHSERVFLVGICDGATQAYRLAFRMPERIGGVIALNGSLPRNGPLFRFKSVRGLNVFVAHGIANVGVPLSVARREARLLYTAGLNVQMKTYAATHRLHPDMLRDANRWVIERITADDLAV